MSYAQAMRWHKKHPRGGKAQYMGFDTANAEFIAAGPDVLETLKGLINYHYHNSLGVKPQEYHRAIAAIALVGVEND